MNLNTQQCIEFLGVWQHSNNDLTARLYQGVKGKDATQLNRMLQDGDNQDILHVLRNRISF